MCYNLETSVITFLSAMISGIVAIYLKQYILGLLIICYAQIQLSEVFIWWGLNTNNQILNRFGTAWGKYLLPAQIFIIGLGIYLHTKDVIPLIIGILVYLIVLLIYSKHNHSDVTFYKCGDNCVKYSGKLVWPYPYNWYSFTYAIFIILFMIYVRPLQSKVFIISIFTLTYIVSKMLNYNNAIGSFWCWTTSAFTPIIVIINTMLIKKYGGRIVIS